MSLLRQLLSSSPTVMKNTTVSNDQLPGTVNAQKQNFQYNKGNGRGCWGSKCCCEHAMEWVKLPLSGKVVSYSAKCKWLPKYR
mmetsp:Transcript_31949/g.75154  ORF Transcript_31949/g.75154 Transcript_31949/m.75154 type:complete len:83 (+) Transcript_31949:1945-2193(+)